MDSKWTWWKLWRILRRLAALHRLDDNESAYGKTYLYDAADMRDVHVAPRSGCESTLHEIFHSLVLGDDFIYSSFDISDALKRLNPWNSDINEIRTIAAELVFAERLGLKLCPKILSEYAYTNMQFEWDDMGMVCGEVIEAKTDPVVITAVDELFYKIGIERERPVALAHISE